MMRRPVPPRPSAAAVARALRHYKLLRVDGEPPGNDDARVAAGASGQQTQEQETGSKSTARADALQEFQKAKRDYHDAVLSVLAREPLAHERADDALARLNNARAVLARLGDER